MTTPAIRVSDAARRALHEADAPAIRMTISDTFECALSVDPATDGDLSVDCDGVTIIVDQATAGRADGVVIDFVEGANHGFTIDGPWRRTIRQISAIELAAMMKAGQTFELIDVRTDDERSLARIDGSRLLDKAYHDALLDKDRNTVLVFQCHHGIRSQSAAEYFLREGFTTLFNLQGGIDAWSLLVDPSVPRY
jgi:monothiol glutaredoxin